MSHVAQSLSNPPAWVPNWDAVPFEVACSRCGHNLRGRTNANCPACELSFDWAEAVPIRELTCRQCGYHLYGLRETRCPECGEGFTWEQALADYHRRKIPIFEYRWREEPARSFVRTWWWALRPKKFWQRLDIHDPPRVRPLLAAFAIQILTLAASLLLLSAFGLWLAQLVWAQGNPSWQQPTIADFLMAIIEIASDLEFWAVPITLAGWAGLGFAALLIFQQSMRLCRVRTAHVLRVWSWTSLEFALPIAFLGFVAGYGLTLSNWGWRWLDPDAIVVTLTLTMAVCATWGLRCGYRYYLRMPHAGAVAVCVQVIALLAAAIIASLLVLF